jgi:spermidine/putrescine transport system substrate-binding protein
MWALSVLSAYAKQNPQSKLKILNFDDYFAENTLSDYSLQTGMDIALETYGSDTEMTAKFLASNPRYDLVFMSDLNVERYIRLGDLLSPINKTLIPNISHIDKDFLTASFDPNRHYSLPYFWGTLGIGYRKSAFKKTPTLKDLLDSSQYSGRIALLADGATNIQMALKYLGFSLNTTKKEEITQATKLLKKQKKHIKTFAADNGQDLLKRGEVDIVLEWNGDMLQLIDESDEFAFVVPHVGTLLWEDCIVIPARSPHMKEAYDFINYLYSKKRGTLLA